MTNTPLKSIEQKEVELLGDVITAVQMDDRHVYASIRHMCDALDLTTQAQTRRINRHTILSGGFMVAKMATIKGDRLANWLRVDLVPLWLSGVSTRSIKDDDTREKLERFQAEAAKILWEAFRERRLTNDPSFELLLQEDTETVQAYKMAMAVVKLARQQILLEGRVGDTELRLEDAETRLSSIEEQLLGHDVVTEAQASQISQAVKAVALVLSKQNGRNEFGSCYGEVYRRYNVTSYKMIPMSKFKEVMAFLTEWHQSLVGDSPF